MPQLYIVERRQGELPWFVWTISLIMLLLIAVALFYLMFSGQSSLGRVVPSGRVEKRIPVTQVTSAQTNESVYNLNEHEQESIALIDMSWRF